MFFLREMAVGSRKKRLEHGLFELLELLSTDEKINLFFVSTK
jgi:hypothetical protein